MRLLAFALLVAMAGPAAAAPAPDKPAPSKPAPGKAPSGKPEPGKAAKSPSGPPPPPVTAGAKPPLDLAYGAYQRGMYITAYREAASRLDRDPNDAAAMTLIAELYNQGFGVKQDARQAVSFYRLAAQRGEPHAMATLGLMSLDGRGGVPRDPRAARDWLEKAAAKGEPAAAYNLALALLTGGTEAEIAQAARLLGVASEAEIGDAQHALGVMRARGLGGLARDPAEAAKLFFRATRNGSIAGEVEYAIAVYNGEGVPKDEILAARHFRHAAARGNAIAQNRLARMHVTGRGAPRNLVEAAAWHILARAQGLNDPWLDEKLSDLSKADRARAEEYAANRSSS